MSHIRKLNISLFSIILLLTFSCYGGTAVLSKPTSPVNIEWIASVRPFYKKGTCHFKMAATATKNRFQLRYLLFDSNVFLRVTAILTFTRQRVQRNIANLTINLINTRILRLPYPYQDKDFCPHLLG